MGKKDNQKKPKAKKTDTAPTVIPEEKAKK